MKTTLKRLALFITLTLLLAVDYYAAQYYRKDKRCLDTIRQLWRSI